MVRYNKIPLIFTTALIATLGFCGFAYCCEGCAGHTSESQSVVAKWDFFSNYGNYMARTHCLLNESGTPDWPWIIALIGLSLGVVGAYLRIFIFWMRCYFGEEKRDRNPKLWDLALIFLLCAVCGYALNVLIFFWPVYRLLAICLFILNVAAWRFAWNLLPFRTSFTSLRLERELAASLKKENETLEEYNQQLHAEREALKQANLEIANARASLVDLNNDLTQRNKELDDFAYVASHDLKAPLRAIDHLARWISEDIETIADEKTLQDLDTLQSRVKRMEGLLDDLLEYSRTGRREYEDSTFHAQEFVRETCSVLDLAPHFELDVVGGDFEIEAKKAPLSQVIRNLVDNARKHHDQQSGCITVRIEQQEDTVEFIVEDDGPGIAAEFQSRIFEMFHTLKPRDEVEGSGMGFAVVRKQVEANGGSISVSSQGRGTRFRFTWPTKTLATTGAENEE